MNCEDTTRHSDDSSDRAQTSRVHVTGIEAPSFASDCSLPSAPLDAVAISTLSSNALTRHRAHKEGLLARDQDEEATVFTLTLFIWDLSESR